MKTRKTPKKEENTKQAHICVSQVSVLSFIIVGIIIGFVIATGIHLQTEDNKTDAQYKELYNNLTTRQLKEKEPLNKDIDRLWNENVGQCKKVCLDTYPTTKSVDIMGLGIHCFCNLKNNKTKIGW